MSSWVQQESPTFFNEPPVSVIPAQQIKKLKARCRQAARSFWYDWRLYPSPFTTHHPPLTTHHSPLTDQPSPINLHPHSNPNPDPDPNPNPNPDPDPNPTQVLRATPPTSLPLRA